VWKIENKFEERRKILLELGTWNLKSVWEGNF